MAKFFDPLATVPSAESPEDTKTPLFPSKRHKEMLVLKSLVELGDAEILPQVGERSMRLYRGRKRDLSNQRPHVKMIPSQSSGGMYDPSTRP